MAWRSGTTCRWPLARLGGVCLALWLGVAVLAAEPSPAAVTVKTKRISPSSPFSPSADCADRVPGFTRGFAQETSVAVNPRDPRNILVAWIQDGRATDVVMASRDGGRSFSRNLVPALSACTGGAFDVASDPGVEFSADGRLSYFSAIVVDLPQSIDVEEANTSMFASRSLNGGFSWSVPGAVQQPTNQFWDLPRLTPDPRRPQKAYYVYDLRKPPDFLHGYSVLATTTNGGRSWSAARPLYDPQTPDSWPGISKLLVNRDGSLLVVFALVGAPPANAGPEAVSSNPT
jgi:hypothetical protein